MLFRAALALEIDRQEIRAAGEQKPDDLAAIINIAHKLRNLGKDAIAHAAVTGAGAVAKLGVGFIDDDADGAHGLEQVEHALQVAFSHALPHAAEIFERDRGNADLAGEAGGDERFAGAYGTANHVAHGQHVSISGLDGGGGIFELLLGHVIAGDIRKIKPALNKFEQPAGLRFDQFLFAIVEELER